MAAAAATGIGGGSLSSGCTHRPLCPPSSRCAALSDHPTHPLRMGLIPFSVCRDCTAWGRYWGAYGSVRGGAPLILCLLVPLSLSLLHSLESLYLSFYLFLLPFANLPFYRSYAHISSVSAFPVPSILPLNRPPPPPSAPPPILPSHCGEMRGERFMDEGDPRNSAAEELPISDTRADAYTQTSGTRLGIYPVGDLRIRAREIIRWWYKNQC